MWGAPSPAAVDVAFDIQDRAGSIDRNALFTVKGGGRGRPPHTTFLRSTYRNLQFS
jgi:hypothetical protein